MNKKILPAVIVSSLTALALTVAFVMSQSDEGLNGSVNYPHYTEMFGVEDGSIVKFDLNNGSAEEVYFDGDISEAVVTENYFVYTSKDGTLHFDNNEATSSDRAVKMSDVPTSKTLTSLLGDKVMYGVTNIEPLSEDEHDHDDGDHEEGEILSSHDVFYTEYIILNLDNLEDTVSLLNPETGTPVQANLFDVSFSKQNIVVTDIHGASYLYDSDGNFIEKLELNVSKIGFLTETVLWYSDATTLENSDQELKLYNIETKETENLFSSNSNLSEISVLDIKQVGNYYLILGNSYKGGSPKQTLFRTDLNFDSFEGIVNLTSLSLNSNGKLFPLNKQRYMLDVRSASKPSEVAVFVLRAEGGEASVLTGVGNLFAK